jgi:CBS domain-containing protein
MAKIADLIARKGARVHCVAPSFTVLDAIQLMNQQKIGAVVVSLNDRIVGMFTERDVLTRVVGQRDPAQTLIEDVMTLDVAFCRPGTDVDQVSAIMRTRRIRHLPVCDDEGRLLGLISIGDLNAFYSDGQEAEIHYLHEYIHGRV